MSRSPVSSRPSTPGSSSSDEDEHTLYAYGDISLSKIFFIPSLSSTVTPRREDSWMDEEKEKKTPPQSVRKKSTRKHALPSVIQKILPPSPSAAELSPKSDFERLVAKLRETRVSDSNPPHPGLVVPFTSEPIQQPQPRQMVNRKAIDKIQDKAGIKDTLAKERVPFQISARMNAAKPKEKPFRGGRLPIRPPLPRWDPPEPSCLPGALCR